MTNPLQFSPGQFWQGQDEVAPYTVNVGNWFAAPAAACTVIKEGTTVRSSSNFQSAASAGATISTCYVTTPCIVALRPGVDYRVEVMAESGGVVREGYFMLTGVT